MIPAAILLAAALAAKPVNQCTLCHPDIRVQFDRSLHRSEEVTCTACHGFKLVAQQGMTRAQWEDSINLMVRRHNMPPPDDRDREVLLGYLETAYPPRAPAGRGGWQNPFAK